MTNQAGIWQSKHPWNFTEIGQNGSIENETLFVLENTTVDEILLAKGNSNRTWTKGVPNQEGYFTLTDPETKKVLTAINSTSLEIKGNAK